MNFLCRTASLIRFTRPGLLAATLLTLAASGLEAQRMPEPLVARSSAQLARGDDALIGVAQAPASSFGRPLAGSLLGAAGGMLVGGVVGLFVGGNRCSDEGNPDSCLALGGMLIGAAAGVTLGAPVGAHLVNRRQGSLPASLLTSVAIAGAGIGLLAATDRLDRHSRNNGAQVSVALGVPILQTISAAVIEHYTSRR